MYQKALTPSNRGECFFVLSKIFNLMTLLFRWVGEYAVRLHRGDIAPGGAAICATHAIYTCGMRYAPRRVVGKNGAVREIASRCDHRLAMTMGAAVQMHRCPQSLPPGGRWSNKVRPDEECGGAAGGYTHRQTYAS